MPIAVDCYHFGSGCDIGLHKKNSLVNVVLILLENIVQVKILCNVAQEAPYIISQEKIQCNVL